MNLPICYYFQRTGFFSIIFMYESQGSHDSVRFDIDCSSLFKKITFSYETFIIKSDNLINEYCSFVSTNNIVYMNTHFLYFILENKLLFTGHLKEMYSTKL